MDFFQQNALGGTGQPDVPTMGQVIDTTGAAVYTMSPPNLKDVKGISSTKAPDDIMKTFQQVKKIGSRKFEDALPVIDPANDPNTTAE